MRGSDAHLLTVIVLAAALSPADTAAQLTPPAVHKERTRMLVHVTQGPENPTRAALAFLVAKTAIDEGDAVTLFLAGDGAVTGVLAVAQPRVTLRVSDRASRLFYVQASERTTG
jgi:hypothetical protein